MCHFLQVIRSHCVFNCLWEFSLCFSNHHAKIWKCYLQSDFEDLYTRHVKFCDNEQYPLIIVWRFVWVFGYQKNSTCVRSINPSVVLCIPQARKLFSESHNWILYHTHIYSFPKLRGGAILLSLLYLYFYQGPFNFHPYTSIYFYIQFSCGKYEGMVTNNVFPVSLLKQFCEANQ